MFGASERCLDPQLWHACAGAMVQMPPLNSKVLYFPQGHAEHSHERVDFGSIRIPSLIPCRFSAIRYMAEQDTDEVFVKLKLTPLRENELDLEEEEDEGCIVGMSSTNSGNEEIQKADSFAKTLTQSDANNGGGFSVPRYCAETIFPRLDYSADPPVQNIVAKDVHGHCWKFRHIYRGTPRRHLLTTGWSSFVSHKKLVAGDSIVFLRAKNGELCVGIRRAKNGYFSPLISGGFLCDKKHNESVVEAVSCAIKGRPFEVVYYPRGSTPEYFVRASLVRDAMRVKWCCGMRFKMPFETEDSSRISWFMGTISSVQVADPVRWPDSPWRLLQVVWDEPDLLQNVKCVSPWLVELVSNMPTYHHHHLSPFSSQRKKPRFLENPDFHLTNQRPMPAFSSNLINHTNSLCNHIGENSPVGIQGARHCAQFGMSPSDYSPFSKLPSSQSHLDISCLLSVGNSDLKSKDRSNEVKSPTPHILLFGQVIHTEQKSSNSCCASTNGNISSSDEGTLLKESNALDENSPTENSSDGGSPWYKDQQKPDLRTESVNLLCLAL